MDKGFSAVSRPAEGESNAPGERWAPPVPEDEQVTETPDAGAKKKAEVKS